MDKDFIENLFDLYNICETYYYLYTQEHDYIVFVINSNEIKIEINKKER